jgi:hypothetical protein
MQVIDTAVHNTSAEIAYTLEKKLSSIANWLKVGNTQSEKIRVCDIHEVEYTLHTCDYVLVTIVIAGYSCDELMILVINVLVTVVMNTCN